MTDNEENRSDERSQQGRGREGDPSDPLRPGHDPPTRAATRTQPPEGRTEFRTGPPRPRDPAELEKAGLLDVDGEEEDGHGDPLSRFITGGDTKKEDEDLPEGSVLPRQPRTLVERSEEHTSE